jgi:hypothetical protein
LGGVGFAVRGWVALSSRLGGVGFAVEFGLGGVGSRLVGVGSVRG